MIDWITYMHIFFLFPCLAYVIVIAANGTGKIFNHNARVFMAFLAVVVFIAHAVDATGWLGTNQTTFFAPLYNANVVTVYSGLPLNAKIVIFVLSCCSTFIFYNLFTVGKPNYIFNKAA